MNHNLEILIYDRRKDIVFRKTHEPFGGLSNMASGFKLFVNQVEILSVEALYQACRFPYISEIQQIILDQKSPMAAKMKSKAHRKETRSDWEDIKVHVMRWCLRLKLAQNLAKFGDLLLSTDDRNIVEESRRDYFWGAKPDGDFLLKGANILGLLLMEARKEAKKEINKILQIVEPPKIRDFYLLGDPIRLIKINESETIAVSSNIIRQANLFD